MMNDNSIQPTVHTDFLQNVSNVLKTAQRNAKTAVNLAMVYAYFEIGKMIVEEEQHGQNRAAYGQQIINELSAYLTERFGKGFSVGNLKISGSFITFTRTIKLAKHCLANFKIFPR